MAVGTPKVTDEDGNIIPCGSLCRNGKHCMRQANYPDAKCCDHTCYLHGDQLDRRHQDDARNGGYELRRAIWDRWEKENGYK